MQPMTGLHRLLAAILGGALLATSPVGVPAVAADGAWLDGAPENWNTPGMGVPAAPRSDFFADPQCARLNRPPQTNEDAVVAAAGWSLFAAYQGGWGVVVVSGLVGNDGMCRPMDYQHFVFVGWRVRGDDLSYVDGLAFGWRGGPGRPVAAGRGGAVGSVHPVQ